MNLKRANRILPGLALLMMAVFFQGARTGCRWYILLGLLPLSAALAVFCVFCRCPCCGRHLTRGAEAGFCPYCGGKLDA